MATTFKWTGVGTVVTLLTTQLDGLTTGSVTALGSEIDNTSNLDQMVTIAVHMATAGFTSGANIQIGFVQSTDGAGAAYPTVDSTNFSNYAGPTVYIQGTSAAHDETYGYVSIPPGKWKAVAQTNGCPTLNASGNTVKMYPTDTQSV